METVKRHDPMSELLGTREALISDAIRNFIVEMGLVDPADLIAYIRLERYANLNDVIDSSLEMHFKPGAFKFGYGAECHVDWAADMKISLDMEFCHQDVNAQFRLLLDGREGSVELDQIVFTDHAGDVPTNTNALKKALKESRISQIAV
jgi:hypothetical protein